MAEQPEQANSSPSFANNHITTDVPATKPAKNPQMRVFPASCLRVNTKLGPPTTAAFIMSYASALGAYSCCGLRPLNVPRRM